MDPRLAATSSRSVAYAPPPIPIHGIPRPIKITEVEEQDEGRAGYRIIHASCMDGDVKEWGGPPQFSLISLPGLCEDKAPIISIEGPQVILAAPRDGCLGRLRKDIFATAKLPLGRPAEIRRGRLLLVAGEERLLAWLAPYVREETETVTVVAPSPGEAASLMSSGQGFSDHIAVGSLEYLENLVQRLPETLDPLLIVDVRAKCGLGLCGSCLIGNTGLLACVEGPGIRASFLRG